MGESQALVTGAVVAIWRYPVKSMMGEELNATEVTERAVLGDRAFALIDAENGKVVSAKNPRRWPNLFDFRATYLAQGSGRAPHRSPGERRKRRSVRDRRPRRTGPTGRFRGTVMSWPNVWDANSFPPSC
jgi:uncharacterized protein YcbX